MQDLNQPLHAAWGETRAEHNEIEVQMLYRSWQKHHTYRGFMLVKNYACFAHQIAEKSSQHAKTLFFDREIRRITEIAWDQAVNDTANLWQSAFWHALGPERGSYTAYQRRSVRLGTDLSADWVLLETRNLY